MMNAFRVVLARSSNSIHHHNNFFVTRQHARQATSSLSTSGGIPQSAPTTTTATKSARSKFKEIPVNPSILKYVQNVGVGIPKRNTRKRRLGKRRKIKGKDSVVLGRVEELEQFGRIRRGGRQTDRTRAPPPPFSIPSRFSSIESNTNIIRHPVKLLASIGTLEKKLPRESKFRPEVVLAGRSNVGKSTLLNSLLYSNYEDIFNQKRENDDAATSTSKGSSRKRRGPTRQTAPLPRGLKAATSAKPGETRQINFYQLSATVDDSKYRVAMLLVDLPGYGFAYASEDQAKQYRTLMENYILDRGNSLKRLLLLIDARHGMKKTDIEFIEALQDAMHSKTSGGQQSSSKKRVLPPIQIVLTKCDLVPQADIARRMTLVRRQLSECLIRDPGILPTMVVSAQMEGQAGVLELQKELAALVPKQATESLTTKSATKQDQQAEKKNAVRKSR